MLVGRLKLFYNISMFMFIGMLSGMISVIYVTCIYTVLAKRIVHFTGVFLFNATYEIMQLIKV